MSEHIDNELNETIQPASGDTDKKKSVNKKPVKMRQGYHYDKDQGVFFYTAKVGEDGTEQPVEAEDMRYLCDPLKIVALTIDEDDHAGKLLEWRREHDHKKIVWNMPDDLLYEQVKLWKELSSRGLRMATNTDALGLLKGYLNDQSNHARYHVVKRLGWYEKQGNYAYMLPTGPITGTGVNLYYAGDTTQYVVRGTLEQWQQHVGKQCRGNSRMLFSVSIPFAAPLLHLLNEPNSGFNFSKSSQAGGTSGIMDTAYSVTGWLDGGDTDIVPLWRATDNGLEGSLIRHCDGIIALDEIGMATPLAVSNAVYMLGNGAGKVRADQSGEQREAKHGRVILLSCGEITLSDKMAEAGLKRRGGQETRLIEIPADAGKDMGVFENIHEAASPREFAEGLRAATKLFGGTALQAYLSKLVAAVNDDHAGLIAELTEQRRKFIADNLPAGASPQVGSICGRFAIVALGGELATKMGITGWQAGDATQAAITCFQAWKEDRGHIGSTDTEEGIQRVLAGVEKYGESRFELLIPGSHGALTPPLIRWGYRQHVRDSQPTPEGQSLVEKMMDGPANDEQADYAWQYMFTPEGWREVTKPYNGTNVAKAMAERGLLIKDDDRQYASRIKTAEGKRVRVYKLRPNLLDAG